jgi:hypothetical protein
MESVSTAAGTASPSRGGALKDAIVVDTEQVRGHLDEVVRSTVEQTLNQLLDEEADRVAGAGKYERSEGRMDTRAGSYRRKLQTKAGEVELKVPRLRKLPLETAIIERYKRRESSVEEALIEMYLAGVSMRRVEDITEALWGTRVSASAVSGMAQKVYGQIESWRNRKIEGEHAYVYLDGIWLKRSWGGEVKNVAVLIAIGVDQEGYREVLGVAEGTKEDELHGLPARALAVPADQQPAGAAQPGGAQTHPRRGRLPGRAVGVDAGGGPAAARGRHPLGPAEIPGHGPADRAGVDGADNDGAARGRVSRIAAEASPYGLSLSSGTDLPREILFPKVRNLTDSTRRLPGS